jgi:putative addiction module killer protein
VGQVSGYEIKHHPVFDAWYRNLEISCDQELYRKVRGRLDRVKAGNLGDHKSVGDGVSELRFKSGAGLRIYYKWCGMGIIFLLCSGNKTGQQADIARAKQLSKEGAA